MPTGAHFRTFSRFVAAVLCSALALSVAACDSAAKAAGFDADVIERWQITLRPVGAPRETGTATLLGRKGDPTLGLTVVMLKVVPGDSFGLRIRRGAGCDAPDIVASVPTFTGQAATSSFPATATSTAITVPRTWINADYWVDVRKIENGVERAVACSRIVRN